MRMNIHVPTKDPLDPENFYADAASPGNRRHGVILVDGKEYAATIQCRHCGGHFVYRKNRGDWVCLRCNGLICGNTRCVNECVNFEKRLDDYEREKIASL